MNVADDKVSVRRIWKLFFFRLRYCVLNGRLEIQTSESSFFILQMIRASQVKCMLTSLITYLRSLAHDTWASRSFNCGSCSQVQNLKEMTDATMEGFKNIKEITEEVNN
jgi:hypothetical protein